VYGGFKGDETQCDQRDIAAHETVLDGAGDSDKDRDADTVVKGGHNAVLDGFTITGAVEDGMVNTDGATWVTNCTFQDNNGSGMKNRGTSPRVTSCVFSGNALDGMHNWESSPLVVDCDFVANSMSGMRNVDSSSPEVINCTFEQNKSHGGMVNINGGSTVITHCTFVGNENGGMYNNSASPVVRNSIFQENTTDNSGGAVRNDTGSIFTAINSLFVGNAADQSGGGIYNSLLSASMITNCTLVDNTADLDNNGIDSAIRSQATVVNSILWGNGTMQIVDDGALSTVSYSTIEGGWDGDGDGNLDEDPLLDEAYRLLRESPCVDQGDNDAVPEDVTDVDTDGDVTEPTPDLDGNERIVNETVDMGAYEYQN
jgi:hypothetical protein